ncbi:MAG: gamma carbonic anhydrase family protein [Candidatus Aquicultorales bacterium]
MIKKWRESEPRVGEGTFIAENAVLIGDVTVGDSSGIWFGAVVRADIAPISIGSRTSIQDGCVLHVDPDVPMVIGDDVTVGHRCVLHSARIGNGSLIGMGAVVLDSEIGEDCLVGAGALVPNKKSFPPRSLILGSPAKVVRELTDEDLRTIRDNKDSYVVLTAEYLENA